MNEKVRLNGDESHQSIAASSTPVAPISAILKNFPSGRSNESFFVSLALVHLWLFDQLRQSQGLRATANGSGGHRRAWPFLPGGIEVPAVAADRRYFLP